MYHICTIFRLSMHQAPTEVFICARIKAFLDSDASVFILRGYAGTGKTTMVRIVADYIAQHHDVRLMAPTGRAARVLSKKSGHVAVTIHKAIYNRAHAVSKDVNDVAASEYKLVFPICTEDHRIASGCGI